MVKLLSVTQRTTGDDDMWDRQFKAVLLILLDLMKDEDVNKFNTCFICTIMLLYLFCSA